MAKANATGLGRFLRRCARVAGWLALASAGAVGAFAAAPARKVFHVPAGDAVRTLAEFARQSEEQIVYFVDNVQGENTAAIEGEFAAFDALQAMLAGTRLAVHRDRSVGAMIVARRVEAASTVSRRRGPRAGAVEARDDDIVRMTQFTVSADAIDRYRSADAISAARVRTDLLETPSSISVMTRDAIDDLMPTRLFEVTRYLAGIEEGRGITFADRQIIRGFESSGRTVDNFFQTGADNFDEALVDRIEVSKGPNAILAPAGVPGGSINVITKSPQFLSRRSLTTVLGLFDAQKVTLDAGGPIARGSRVAYRAIAAAQDSRRYWAEDARLRGKVLAPMLTWRMSDRSQLTVKLIAAEHWVFREPGLILDSAVTLETGNPALAPGFSPRSRNGIQPWSHVGTRTTDAFALFTSQLTEQIGVRLAGNVRRYFEDSTQEFFSTPSFNNRYDPTSGLLSPNHTWALDPATGRYVATLAPLFTPTAIPVRGDTQSTTSKTANLQADVAARQAFAWIDAQTVAGLALGRMDNRGRSWTGTLPPLDLTRPDFRADPIWAADPYLDLKATQTTQSFYLNQKLTFAADRVQFTGGAMRYGVVSRSLNRAAPGTPESVLDDSRSLWLGSVLVKLRPNVSLYFTHSTNSAPVIANDLPLWRDGRQDEFGVKSEFFGQRLSLTAAWFRIKQTNVTIPNPEHQTDPNAPEQLIADLGDRGLELELSGALTPRLSIIASFAQLRLRDSLGRSVRGVADRNTALLLNWRPFAGEWARTAFYFGISHAGERPGDSTAVNFTALGVATQQSFRVPAYEVTSLGASSRWGRWHVRLKIDNVLGQKHHVQSAGGRVSGTGLSTAPGTNVKLSTTLEF